MSTCDCQRAVRSEKGSIPVSASRAILFNHNHVMADTFFNVIFTTLDLLTAASRHTPAGRPSAELAGPVASLGFPEEGGPCSGRQIGARGRALRSEESRGNSNESATKRAAARRPAGRNVPDASTGTRPGTPAPARWPPLPRHARGRPASRSAAARLGPADGRRLPAGSGARCRTPNRQHRHPLRAPARAGAPPAAPPATCRCPRARPRRRRPQTARRARRPKSSQPRCRAPPPPPAPVPDGGNPGSDTGATP